MKKLISMLLVFVIISFTIVAFSQVSVQAQTESQTVFTGLPADFDPDIGYYHEAAGNKRVVLFHGNKIYYTEPVREGIDFGLLYAGDLDLPTSEIASVGYYDKFNDRVLVWYDDKYYVWVAGDTEFDRYSPSTLGLYSTFDIDGGFYHDMGDGRINIWTNLFGGQYYISSDGIDFNEGPYTPEEMGLNPGSKPKIGYYDPFNDLIIIWVGNQYYFWPHVPGTTQFDGPHLSTELVLPADFSPDVGYRDILRNKIVLWDGGVAFESSDGLTFSEVQRDSGINIYITENVGNYQVGQDLQGSVSINFDKYLPSTSVIRAYIDHDLISEIDLSDRLPSTNYKVNVFDYNITARLNITWYDYPEQNFEYNLRVDGTCGNEECAGDGSCNCLGICSVPNNPPYECSWQNDFIADESETVTGAGSGTTEIYDGSYIQLPPSNNLEDTSWQVECRDGSFSENCGQSPGPDGSQVQLTMRTSCDNYAHTPWIEEEIPKANLQVCTNDIFPGCDGINDFYITFDAFDSESLNYGYKKYGGPSGLDGGGIYKNGVYQSYDSDALWDGDAGIVVILNYNSQATYLINRLPANGPILCAYTDYIIQNFEINEYDETISGTDMFGNPVECSYDNKYSIIYHLGDMATIFPDYHQTCSGKNDCTATFIVPSHLFTDNDQTDYLNFHITYRPPHKELTLNVTTDLAELDNLYSVSSIDFSEFGGLTVSNSGEHILRFIIEDGGDIIASSSVRYTSCTDSDNDGFCSIEENGNDCNDADETINPEAQELCDGIDNNCIGGIDDGFDLGAECYIGSTEIINGHVASICMGEIVCMEDGSNSMCQTFVKPGDSEEICNNTYDDDCDGLVDEDDNMWIDGIWQNCTMPCRDGDPCGTDSGTCQFGVKHCYQNQSYDCIGGESPCGGTWDELIYGCEETRCNRVDEDCDGIIDNIGGATSASDAHCWCFGGTSPRSESDEPCNDMDDDCDGYIDEGLVCCEAGQTRQCGETDVGECSYGTQTCTSYGSWDSTCVGEISPVQEICYDNKDNDCDGEIDDYEICNPDVTCFNGIWDINEEGTDCGGVCDQPCKEGDSTMILIIVIVVVVAAVFILFKYKKKLFGKKVDKRRESYQRPKRRPWYRPRY